MTKPIIRIHNSETDEIIDREMTKAEYTQYLKDVADNEAAEAVKLAEIEAKATAKQAIADRLGLTADELTLLLG